MNKEFKIHEVTGYPGGEAFVIESEERFLLYDAGFAFAAEALIRNIKSVTGGSPLDYILLSHSHYDHVMGSPKVKKAFPEAKVVAHRKVRSVFAKESARKTMQDLDDNVAGFNGVCADEGSSERLAVDIDVSDGDSLEWGGTGEIQVIETPGHTNCSVSFYFPESGLIAAGESLGLTYNADKVTPEFVTSYDDTISSIKKIHRLDPDHILFPHNGLLDKKRSRTFFEDAKEAAKELRDLILDMSREGKTQEEILSACKDLLYYGRYAEIQPDDAFLLNRSVMVERVIACFR